MEHTDTGTVVTYSEACACPCCSDRRHICWSCCDNFNKPYIPLKPLCTTFCGHVETSLCTLYPCVFSPYTHGFLYSYTLWSTWPWQWRDQQCWHTTTLHSPAKLLVSTFTSPSHQWLKKSEHLRKWYKSEKAWGMQTQDPLWNDRLGIHFLFRGLLILACVVCNSCKLIFEAAIYLRSLHIPRL